MSFSSLFIYTCKKYRGINPNTKKFLLLYLYSFVYFHKAGSLLLIFLDAFLYFFLLLFVKFYRLYFPHQI